MSECDKYKNIIESVANGECSEADKALLDAHVLKCRECREELSFVMSINETLHSLPKMEVPDNFLVSLNQRLDVEEKIKARASEKTKRNIFRYWKKYSALTACLLLAVLVQINVWDLPVNNRNNDVVVEVSDEQVAEQDKSDAAENTTDTKDEVAVAEESKATEKISIQPVGEIKTPVEENVNKNNQNKVTAKPEKKNQKDRVPQKTQVSSGPVVQKNNTTEPKKQDNAFLVQSENKAPVSDVQNNREETTQPETPKTSGKQELPEYMDNKDNIIVMPEGKDRVDFDDYEIVVTEEFLEAFSMAEMPSNNVIVASPAAMASIENISIDTSAACPVPETNYGAGSGSLLVSASDVQKVQSILNKYSTGAQNQTFMLTSSNYNSFINELKGEGIEYHDYMIHAGRSNVAFTLIAS